MANKTEENLIPLLTAEEKIALQTGQGSWNTAPVEKLGVTSVRLSDGPLGLRKTVDGNTLPAVAFPCMAKVACSFDTETLKDLGVALGEQCRAENVDVLLGPAVNVKRDPRCGRNFEYVSEDPYLTAELASAYVEGVTSQGVGVCLKHFAANSQEYGRMVCDSVIDERALREIYLSAFERIIKRTNPCAVMCSYNRLCGEYCSQSKRLLTDVLRGEWGFKGLVMSDWGATDSRVEGIKAGLDLEMPQGDTRAVAAAYENGELTSSQLDAAADNVIRFSKLFGATSARTLDVDEQARFARKLSAECTVLVKNNCNLLPLNRKDKLAVIGALAESPVYQGGGSSCVNAFDSDSLVDAMRENNLDFLYSDGSDLDDAREKASSASKVILVVGDKPDCEGYDRASWSLPDEQLRLIDTVTSANSEVVLVLQCGSSVDTSFAHSVKAMLVDYYGGQRSGHALYDVIFGDVAPQGRLAETWYANLPETAQNFGRDYHRALYKESIYVGYRYTSTANVETSFPFGYGLSYSEFKWGTPTVSHRDKTKITVTVPVTNVGNYADSEVVQVYASNLDCRDFVEKKKLVGFAKVKLKRKEKKTATIVIPTEELAHFDAQKGEFVLNGGRYLITVGKNVCDERFKEEYVVSGDNLTCDTSDKYPCYYNIDESFNPTDEQFKTLYGREFAQMPAQVGVSTPLGDLTKGFTAKIVKRTFTRRINETDAHYAMATPLRAFVSPSFSVDMLLTVVDMLNGTVFKNLWKLFKQYLVCKKMRKKTKGEQRK